MSKNIIDTVVSFVDKYGDEALGVARALDAIMTGLALMPNERAVVKETINKLEEAAENITKAKKPAKIVINKKDIVDAVKAELPSILNDAINDAVKEAVAVAINDMMGDSKDPDGNAEGSE